MHNGKRALGTASLMAIVALLATGCSGILGGGGTAGGGGSDTGPILLGAVVPRSGSSAPSGVYMANGMKMAVKEINAKGGVLGGRKLELDIQDEACDPTQATAAANKLVSSGVVVSVGGYCSGATLPTLPVFNRANVPMIIPAANSYELVQQNLPNVFLINGTGVQQAAKALDFLTTQGVKTVALIDDKTSYSSNITDQTSKDIAAQGGITVALKTSITPGESDYSSVVNQVKSANPELVYFTGYYQEAGLVINQLRASGYQGTIMVADGSVDPSLIKIAGGSNAEGVFATMTQTPATIEGAGSWIADYTKQFGSAPGPYSTQSYDAVRLAAEAIRKAGSTDGRKIISALKGIDGFKLFSGPLKFTKQGTLSDGGFQILVVKNGEFVLSKG